MNKILKTTIYIFISAAIITYLLYKADLNKVILILNEAKPAMLIVGIILSYGQTIIDAAKWNALLRFKNICIPFFKLIANQMVGLFVSSFLPSRYSGDIYRTYLLSRTSGRPYEIAASVLLQRLSGLFVLGLSGAIGAIVCFFTLKIEVISIVVFCTGIAIMACVVILFLTPIKKNLMRIEKISILSFVMKKIVKLHDVVFEYRKNQKLLIKIFSYSLLFYFEAFVIIFTACLAVDEDVHFIYVMLVMPMIYLLEALPISLNGHGIREGAFIYFFGEYGLAFEKAFAISIIVLFYRLLKCLSGGLVFALIHVKIEKASLKGAYESTHEKH